MSQVIVAGTLGAEFQKHGADLPRDVSIAMLVVRAPRWLLKWLLTCFQNCLGKVYADTEYLRSSVLHRSSASTSVATPTAGDPSAGCTRRAYRPRQQPV